MTVFVLTDAADNFPSGDDNSGDDDISGLNGADLIHGGAGNDFIYGGAGDDSLYGDAGDDVIDLGPQPSGDFADGGSGIDTIYMDFSGMVGGNGKPVKLTVDFLTRAWSVLVNGSATVDLTRFEKLYLICGNGSDTVYGGALGDTINGAGGNDLIKAGAGDDQVEKSWGIYKLSGGDGADTLTVQNSNARDLSAGLTFDATTGNIAAGTSASGTVSDFEIFAISGTENADSVTTGPLGDAALGRGGNDLLTMGGGNDNADGGGGADTLMGGAGNDTLTSGTPVAGAAQAADRLLGGAGDDRLAVELPALGALFTFAGAVFNGGADTDALEFQPRNAILDLTGATLTGIESLLYQVGPTFGIKMTSGQLANLSSALDIDLNLGTLYITTGGTYVPSGDLNIAVIKLSDAGNTINLQFSTRSGSTVGTDIIGGAGADNIQGTDRVESLSGLGGDDILVGRGGQDTLTGGDGRDTIIADDGNDRIIGGAGGDALYGGTTGPANKDLFTYTAASDSFGPDTADLDLIDDFLVAGGGGVDFIDRIDVSQIDAKAAGGSNDVFGFIGVDPFSAEGQIRATQSGTSTVIEFNIAGTSGAEMIVILANFTATNLTQYDFFL